MNMFEEARAIKGMIELCSLTQSEVAKKLGISQSYVANKIRLLGFSLPMQESIISSGISERHARTLLRLGDEEQQKDALEKIKAMHLNVAQTEAIVDGMILEKMTERAESAAEGIERVDKLISESVKALLSLGVRARKTTEFYSKRRYITVFIDET